MVGQVERHQRLKHLAGQQGRLNARLVGQRRSRCGDGGLEVGHDDGAAKLGCRVGYDLPGEVGVARLALGELLWGLRVVDEDGDERFRERHQVLLAVAFVLQEHLLGVELADGLAHEDHRELDRDGFLCLQGSMGSGLSRMDSESPP